MKEIIAQYGSMLIAVIVGCGILFGMMRFHYRGHTGLPGLLGEWMQSESAQTLSDPEENAVFDRYCSDGPELVFTGQEIVAGREIEVSRCFQASGSEYRNLPVEVDAVLDLQGNRYPTRQHGGKEYLYLEQAGVYQIVLEALDSKQRTVQALITFPVQAR